jgi:hypothetical protein
MRILAISVLLVVTACGRSPSSTPTLPTPVVVAPARDALVGMWTGTAQVLTCAGRACSPWVTQPEPPRRFSLTVIEDAGQYVALLDLDVRVHFVLEVAGTRQPDGTIRFTGSHDDPIGSTRDVDVDAFDVRIDPLTGLAGEFTYRLHWNTGPSEITGRIVEATRRSIESIRNFDGVWIGQFVTTAIRRCDGTCNWTVGGANRLILSLTGNTAAGGRATVWSSFPVSGSTAGATALLAGQSPTVSPCPNPGIDAILICAESIRDLSLSIDRFGRLVGTLDYARDGWSGGSTSLARYYAVDVSGTLLDVVRQ